MSGSLADPGDLDDFAARLGSLLFDRERARAMGRAARRVAEERFARDHVVALYESLYRRLLAEDPGT